jgi:hypothetical protein
VNKNRALVFVFTALLILSMTAFPAYAAITETFTINPPSTTQYTFYLPSGTIFNGSISTSGTLRVWVTNSSGVYIVNLGLVDKASNFGFLAGQDGNYTVYFENDLPNPVQVTFSYDTDPQITSPNSALIPLSYLPLFIAIVVLGSVIILFLVRRKNRKALSYKT